jgi:hypothetical protein
MANNMRDLLAAGPSPRTCVRYDLPTYSSPLSVVMRQNEHIGPTCRKPFALCDGRHQGFECLGADRARLASACGASARASSDRLGANARFDDASSSGILPYEAGIERTTATTPEATKKQRQLPAIQVGKCAGRANCVRISIPFVVRPRGSLHRAQ